MWWNCGRENSLLAASTIQCELIEKWFWCLSLCLLCYLLNAIWTCIFGMCRCLFLSCERQNRKHKRGKLNIWIKKCYLHAYHTKRLNKAIVFWELIQSPSKILASTERSRSNEAEIILFFKWKLCDLKEFNRNHYRFSPNTTTTTFCNILNTKRTSDSESHFSTLSI